MGVHSPFILAHEGEVSRCQATLKTIMSWIWLPWPPRVRVHADSDKSLSDSCRASTASVRPGISSKALLQALQEDFLFMYRTQCSAFA